MLGLGNSLSTAGVVSGVLPTDIDDLVMWFTFEEGLTLDGSSVNCWAAKVGSFYGVPTSVADGSPGADRPTFNTTHVTFDGGDDIDFWDACSSGSRNELVLDTGNGGWTVIGILTDDNWTGAQQALVGLYSGSTDFIRYDAPSGEMQIEMKINNNTKTIKLDSNLTNDQYYSIMVTHETGGTITAYIDNVAQAVTQSLAATNDLTVSAIGQRSTADRLGGNIKHVLAYDKVLTSNERSQFQTWAATQL